MFNSFLNVSCVAQTYGTCDLLSSTHLWSRQPRKCTHSLTSGLRREHAPLLFEVISWRNTVGISAAIICISTCGTWFFFPSPFPSGCTRAVYDVLTDTGSAALWWMKRAWDADTDGCWVPASGILRLGVGGGRVQVSFECRKSGGSSALTVLTMEYSDGRLISLLPY